MIVLQALSILARVGYSTHLIFSPPLLLASQNAAAAAELAIFPFYDSDIFMRFHT